MTDTERGKYRGRWPQADDREPSEWWAVWRAILPRSRFRRWTWVCSIGFVLAVIAVGTIGFDQRHSTVEALYRSIQLFGLNFDSDDSKNINNWMQIARFAAPVVLLAALIKLLADGIGENVRRSWHTRKAGGLRDVVLGFGPVGQAVGRRLLAEGRQVTWIAPLSGDDEALRTARDDAEAMGGYLIIGDPSGQRQFSDARLNWCERVFVALNDDLAALDAAEAARLWLQKHPPKQQAPEWTFLPLYSRAVERVTPRKIKAEPSLPSLWSLVRRALTDPVWWLGADQSNAESTRAPDIRVFTYSPELTVGLPQAAASGFVSGRDISVFNLRTEAVRRLVLRARFDRTALLLGQDRVHLVIAGCGWQGEALLDEALLLCLRAGLQPPLVTVLDQNASSVRDRIARRSPALLADASRLGIPDWLSPRFEDFDLNTENFANAPLGDVPVTAWAICSADDDLNLRAALAVQTAMQRRQLDGAPIYTRVWQGHDGEAHRLGMDGVSQTNVFGSLNDALDGTPALDEEPDRVAKALHNAYLATEAKSKSIKYPTLKPNEVTPERAVDEWEKLSPTKKQSNRRAHRHAPFKLADLGFDWPSGETARLPRFGSKVIGRVNAVEMSLAEHGFKNPSTPNELRFLEAMENEHDRWTIDRAIDGWQQGPRDEGRQLHPDMVPFVGLGADTKAYDGVLLRALLEREVPEDRPVAVPYLPLHFTLYHGLPLQANLHKDKRARATEIMITLPTGHVLRPEKTKLNLDQPVILGLLKELSALVEGPNFCRLVLVFPAPPTPPILALANACAKLAWAKGRDVHSVWSWTKQAGHLARQFAPYLDPTHAQQEYGLLLGPEGNAPKVSFAGHMKLGNAAVVGEALATTFDFLCQQKPRPALLSGYAGDADVMAVNLWKEKVRLVEEKSEEEKKPPVTYLFPYPDPETKDADPPTHAWTDTPGSNRANRVCFADKGIDPKDVIIMNPKPDGPSGHTLLAQALAEKADWLIAVWDGNKPTPPKPGGTADVVAMMTAQGKPVDVVHAERPT